MVGRKKKISSQELEVSRLEMVYSPNFEKEFTDLLASFIFQHIKSDLEREVSSIE